ncbi:hypothetical protein [Sphingobacterium faecium]|uniref:hypothetical protein n=1 Tax=Sphingobacterium faecium TaxID=34087 RepID=UPI003208ADCD
MNILLTPLQLQTLLRDAAEMGAKSVLTETGQIKPYLKRAAAFRRYGRKNVQHWIGLGLIASGKKKPTSKSWRIGRMEIEAVNKSRRAMHYL